ncbi:hypothetical protein FQN54_006208 [Arachnomyces sp. PD_36]|nr:hypothetical protein FQN54_006208 [Arachnomyces sp. PD_36]
MKFIGVAILALASIATAAPGMEKRAQLEKRCAGNLADCTSEACCEGYSCSGWLFDHPVCQTG